MAKLGKPRKESPGGNGMGKRIGLLLLAAALAMGPGCSSMLARSYVSATDHVDYYAVEEDPSVLRAETYQGLVNSILYFVESHSATGTIRLYNYTGDVEADLANACTEILSEDPLGAYAVRDIRYDTTRIVTYYEISLSVIYARSAEDVASIRSVTGLTGLRGEFSQAISSCLDHIALRTAYFTWTEQYLTELFWISYYSQPLYVLQGLEVDFAFYPETGSQRIIEVSISWPRTTDEVAARAAHLAASADILLLDYHAQGETYTPLELAAVLRAVSRYDPEAGSDDPADILAGAPAGDMGLLLSMELLCQQEGLDAVMVLGSAGQEQTCWLIVETPDGYRHLLAQDLAALVSGGSQDLPLYTDEGLLALGYNWQADLYPVCSG